MPSVAESRQTGVEPRTVLVVEDEVLIRMATADALRQSGFKVVEACDADEALEIIHAQLIPDALLTDIRLPGSMDGLQLAALLESTFPDMLVFVSSGLITRSDLRLSLRFLPKPFDPELAASEIGRAFQ